jgi:hypothetical protein
MASKLDKVQLNSATIKTAADANSFAGSIGSSMA